MPLKRVREIVQVLSLLEKNPDLIPILIQSSEHYQKLFQSTVRSQSRFLSRAPSRTMCGPKRNKIFAWKVLSQNSGPWGRGVLLVLWLGQQCDAAWAQFGEPEEHTWITGVWIEISASSGQRQMSQSSEFSPQLQKFLPEKDSSLSYN